MRTTGTRRSFGLLIGACIVACQCAFAENGGVPTSATHAGRVQCLLITPNGVVYAGTEIGGVLRSGDRGAHWYATTLTDHPIISLVASGDVVFAVVESDLFRSDDAGENWHRLIRPYGMERLHALVVDQGRLYAVTSSAGLVVSEDLGSTWTSVDLPYDNAYAVAVRGTTIYASVPAPVHILR